MPTGVVLDTSYLITLADPTRPNHGVARQYWKEFLTRDLPILLPTIVVSEFYLKQEIPQDILRACVVLPFNLQDAIEAAKLGLPKDGAIASSGSRDRLKDDMKIIAQAAVQDAALVITDDGNSFHKWAKQFAHEGRVKFRSVLLSDGFDDSYFSQSGQKSLGFGEEAGEDEEDEA